MSSYMERPKKLPGVTERINTSCGYIYVTVNNLDGKVIEVFATLIRCNQPTYSDGKYVLSCSDAIAMILKKYEGESTEQKELPLDMTGKKK